MRTNREFGVGPARADTAVPSASCSVRRRWILTDRYHPPREIPRPMQRIYHAPNWQYTESECIPGCSFSFSRRNRPGSTRMDALGAETRLAQLIAVSPFESPLEP